MKMNIHGKIVYGLVALFFSACSHSAPDCADEKMVDTAIQIAEEKFGQEIMKNVTLKLLNIRTTAMDEKLGKYTCAADLEVTGSAGSKRFPVQYTSELADGGKRFYVTVYGL